MLNVRGHCQCNAGYVSPTNDGESCDCTYLCLRRREHHIISLQCHARQRKTVLLSAHAHLGCAPVLMVLFQTAPAAAVSVIGMCVHLAINRLSQTRVPTTVSVQRTPHASTARATATRDTCTAKTPVQVRTSYIHNMAVSNKYDQSRAPTPVSAVPALCACRACANAARKAWNRPCRMALTVVCDVD